MKTSYSLDGSRGRKPVEISMTPLIDVIFLLLVFFLATSSFQEVEKFLPSSVSQPMSQANNSAGSGDEQTPDKMAKLVEQVIVKIKRDGDNISLVFNGQPIAGMDDLRGRFQTLAGVQASVATIINPDPSIPASEVVHAYDAARAAGLTNVYLATHSK